MFTQLGILLFVMIISPPFLVHMKLSFEIGNNFYVLGKIQFKFLLSSCNKVPIGYISETTLA